MRKVDPESVKSDFVSALTDLNSYFDDAAELLSKREGDLSTLSEQTMMSAAVLWEGFISDLIVAYINRDSSEFENWSTNILQESIKGQRAKSILTEYVTVNFPRHFTKSEIEILLDPNQRNLVFFNYSEMKKMTKKLLFSDHYQCFAAIDSRDGAVINAVIAVRNYLAHRSKSSKKRMNDALFSGGLTRTGLKRGINDIHKVGPYLKAVQTGQRRRVVIIMERLSAIAEKLA